MTIGSRIRNCRKDKKLTQKQLGELCGIAEPTIRRYELGKLKPKLETLARIAKALDVQTNDLLPQDVWIETEYDHPPKLKRLFAMEEAFHKLNDEGQQKAVERVQELTEIQRYQARKTEISNAFGDLLSETPEIRDNFISALARIPDEGLPIIADHIVSVCNNPKAYLELTEAERAADTKRLAEQVFKILEEHNNQE